MIFSATNQLKKFEKILQEYEDFFFLGLDVEEDILILRINFVNNNGNKFLSKRISSSCIQANIIDDKRC